MRFLIVIAIAVFAGLVVVGLAHMKQRREVMTRREKRELVRLRILEHSLRAQAMVYIMSDPFATIVLDEIQKSQEQEIN